MLIKHLPLYKLFLADKQTAMFRRENSDTVDITATERELFCCAHFVRYTYGTQTWTESVVFLPAVCSARQWRKVTGFGFLTW